jgi:hypothetical protein
MELGGEGQFINPRLTKPAPNVRLSGPIRFPACCGHRLGGVGWGDAVGGSANVTDESACYESHAAPVLRFGSAA